MSFIERLMDAPWPSPNKHLSDPVSFRMNNSPHIIRTLRKVGDRIMAKLEMDDDNIMTNFEELPLNIQKLIYERTT